MSRRARWCLGALAVLVALVVLVSYLLDEPLRRQVESQMNARLVGYHVTIGKLRVHPIRLAVTLRDLFFVQQANPSPPVGHIPRLHASVHWRALLSGRLVAGFRIDRPHLYVNLAHLRSEAADPRPLSEKGWQEAFEAIYPLKINKVKVTDGAVTYVDTGPFEPLELTHVNLLAENIRNIRSKEQTYPSSIHVDAVVFKTGTLTADGKADFLAEPHPGVKANVALDRIDLEHFKGLTSRYHVAVSKGLLSAAGAMEYAPKMKMVDLEHATITGVQVEYTHTPAEKGVVQAAAAKTEKAVRNVSNEPDLLLRVKELKVVDSTVGFVNKTVNPAYRAFLSHTNLTLTNFSNQRADGVMVAKLTGKFMGSGAAAATATFRPEKSGPDFDLNAQIENTDMRTMNDMLRAYGKFDVAAGTFSVFSEIKVHQGHIDGYVKPLFSHLDVYDPQQDRDKSFGRKLYERVVEGVSKLLKNTPRKEVATVATISGPVDDAKANTFEVVIKLIQNAFFRAILPGFEQQVRGLAGRPAPASGS